MTDTHHPLTSPFAPTPQPDDAPPMSAPASVASLSTAVIAPVSRPAAGHGTLTAPVTAPAQLAPPAFPPAPSPQPDAPRHRVWVETPAPAPPYPLAPAAPPTPPESPRMDGAASDAAARPEGGVAWVRFGERPPDTLARWLVAWTVVAVATAMWMVITTPMSLLVVLQAAASNNGRSTGIETLIVVGLVLLWAAGTVSIVYWASSFYRRVKRRWQPSGALSGVSAQPIQHAP